MPQLPPFAEVWDVATKVIAPAFGASAVVFALLYALQIRSKVAASAAFVAGLLIANAVRGDAPWLPESRGWKFIFPAAVAASIFGVLVQASWMPRWIGLLIRVMASLAAGWALAPDDPLTSVAFAAVVLAEWHALERLGDRYHSLVFPFCLASMTGALALVLIHAHSARFMGIALMASASWGGLALAILHRRADSSSTAPSAAVLLCGLALAGYDPEQSKVPLASFLLVALQPLLYLPLEIGPLSRWKGRGRIIVDAILFVVPLVAAVALAMAYESIAVDEKG
jgi:hypothetical protein